MSIVKSFSVGDGDMFYISHENGTFTIIDCCMSDENRDDIVAELERESSEKSIRRFISTHPDKDHIKGLEYLFNNIEIPNFYCVKNNAEKYDPIDDFEKYCELRIAEKTFHLEQHCRRKWLNEEGDGRGGAGINVLWPDTNNEHYKDALKKAAHKKNLNNISCVLCYKTKDHTKFLWMGDLEMEFLEKIGDNIGLYQVDVLFAPHHSRKSGRIPADLLKIINPKMIIVGEAPSEHLNYYEGYDTITQNSAGDIAFECISGKVHVYVSNYNYTVNFLDTENIQNTSHGKYIGTLVTGGAD